MAGETNREGEVEVRQQPECEAEEEARRVAHQLPPEPRGEHLPITNSEGHQIPRRIQRVVRSYS